MYQNKVKTILVRKREWRGDVNMPPRARRTRGSADTSDVASVVSIASTDYADSDAPSLLVDDDVMQERYDLRALEVLEQELLQVQTLKRDAQSEIVLLLEEQKKLEVMERREKAEHTKKASHGSRMNRIQQLQEQERVRQQQAQTAREKDEQERKARAEAARLKREHSIQARDDEDLDAFLENESSYF